MLCYKMRQVFPAATAALFIIPFSVHVLFPAAWQGAAHAELKYTQNTPQAGRTETVLLYLDPKFADGDRGAIMSAIDEWNHVLNGVIKFEASPLPPAGDRKLAAWTIMRSLGKEGVREVGRHTELSLATLQPLPMGGGMLLVFDQAIKLSDNRALTLRDVMMRELAHLAGLRHVTDAELLSSKYLSGERSCVTEEMASAIAKLHNVTVGAMNWCTGFHQGHGQGRPKSVHHGVQADP